jgi:hypothetical protein
MKGHTRKRLVQDGLWIAYFLNLLMGDANSDRKLLSRPGFHFALRDLALRDLALRDLALRDLALRDLCPVKTCAVLIAASRWHSLHSV